MLVEAGAYEALVKHSKRATLANRILRILVNECGARDDMDSSWQFFNYFTESPFDCKEWRFSGELGFGGKFYLNSGRWSVGCYPEDRTPERDAMIEKANELLAELQAAEGAER